MRRRTLLLTGLGALVAACAPKVSAPPSPAPPATAVASDGPAWPDYVRRADAPTRAAYAFALEDRTVLKNLPCYCGCGVPVPGSKPHLSNRDCFIRSIEPDGTVVFDPHGSACGTCVGIALEGRDLARAGKGLREIRATIDAKWSKAGPGTATPAVD